MISTQGIIGWFDLTIRVRQGCVSKQNRGDITIDFWTRNRNTGYIEEFEIYNLFNIHQFKNTSATYKHEEKQNSDLL